jgi:hypothetical protein
MRIELEPLRRLETKRGKVRLVKINDTAKPFAMYFGLPGEPVELSRFTNFAEAAGAYYCKCGIINPLEELSTPEPKEGVAP